MDVVEISCIDGICSQFTYWTCHNKYSEWKGNKKKKEKKRTYTKRLNISLKLNNNLRIKLINVKPTSYTYEKGTKENISNKIFKS